MTILKSPTLCDHMDYTVHRILQARILEWVGIFPTQKSNWSLLHFRQILYQLSYEGRFWNKLWKILQEMGIPDHLTCLLRNLYACQEAAVRTGHRTVNWSQIGKGVHQGCLLSLWLFNLYAEYIMWNSGLDEALLESRLLGEISVTSDVQMTPPLWQKSKKN